MASTMLMQLGTFLGSLKSSGPLFKIGLGVLAFGAALSIFRTSFDLLSLTGAQLVSFELWRLITHCVVERNPVLLLWSVWCLHHGAYLVEPAWGSPEFIRYLAVVQLVSSFLVAVVSLFSYVLVRNYLFFYHVEISGSASACAGVFVAVKQYLPDSILLTTPFGRLKNTHLPMCAVLVALIFALIGAIRWVVVLQILFGIQTGWLYLRFYQKHEDNEPRGDSSEHFTWSSLFPSKLQPLMNAVSSTFFAILVRAHVCKPIVRHVDISQLDSVSVILPGLQTRDTERRRQKALRDLTERLSRAQRVETGSWPDMEDIEDDIQVVDKTQSVASVDSPQQAQLHIAAVKTNESPSESPSMEVEK